MADLNTPPTPVPAATIMLLRERDEQLQVFMVVRHHQIDFASGALVFPGGKVDAQDFDNELLPYLTDAHDVANMRAIQVSAIREAFEECGVLLAYDKVASAAQGQNVMISGERLNTLDPCRAQLNDGSLPLLAFLEREQLSLACDQLVHFAHWITPPMVPRRFDTHFYLATAPADHLAIHDGYESVDSVWISAKQAIQDAKDGKRTVIFPTLRNIEKLGISGSLEEAMSAARGDTIVPVLPWTEQREDGTYLLIPPEAGYLISEEKMPPREKG